MASKLSFCILLMFGGELHLPTTNGQMKDHFDHEFFGILNTHVQIKSWATKEEKIYWLVKNVQEKLQSPNAILNRYIEDYKNSSEKVGIYLKIEDERAHAVASCGITLFRMIYRFTKYLTELRSMLSQHDSQLNELLNPMPGENQTEAHVWPSEIDMNKTMQAFLHIHEIYNLNLTDLATVLKPKGVPVTVDLLAVHCAQIGLFALDEDYYAMSIEWLELSRTKVTEYGDQSISIKLVDQYLQKAVQWHNLALLRLPDTDLKVFEHAVSVGQTHRLKRMTLYLEEMVGETEEDANEANFHRLCSGEILQNSTLTCHYESKIHPVWLIGPMKFEVLSKDPFVVQIHDILGEDVMQGLVSHLHGELRVSRIFSTTETESMVVEKVRTSVQALISNDDAVKFNKKVELITGLNLAGVRASEPPKVVEYVFGRYYGTHKDVFGSSDAQITNPSKFQIGGNRLASLLFYLNDVDEGGATPLVNLNTKAMPLKGSALMWFQLYKNGTERNDLWHGSCPIIHGHKIMANKWIRYNAQFLKYKCSLNQYE